MLQSLDEQLLAALLATAVADADPEEVMPPVDGPPGWTDERKDAFLRFHRSRSLATPPAEFTYAVVVDEAVVGAARLAPLEEPNALEAGVWFGRSYRGRGLGAAVLRELLDAARGHGAKWLFASTTTNNLAVQRILTAQGTALVPVDDTTLTAWVDLTQHTGVHPHG